MANPIPTLSLLETRVLGTLVEKQHTVPDTYPLTLNALEPGLLTTSSFLIGTRQYLAALHADGTFVVPTTATALGTPAKPGTYGQKLVDSELAKHPDIVILVFHVISADGSDYPIIASNIGPVISLPASGLLSVNVSTAPAFSIDTG